MRSVLTLFSLVTTILLAEPISSTGLPTTFPPVSIKVRGVTTKHGIGGGTRQDAAALAGPLVTEVVIKSDKDGKPGGVYFHSTDPALLTKVDVVSGGIVRPEKIAEAMVDFPCIRETRTKLVEFMGSERAWVSAYKGFEIRQPLIVKISFEIDQNSTRDQVCSGHAKVEFQSELTEKNVSGKLLKRTVGKSVVKVPLSGMEERRWNDYEERVKGSALPLAEFDYDRKFTEAVAAAEADATNSWAQNVQKEVHEKARRQAINEILKNDLK